MLYPMRGAALPRRRYASPHALPAYGLLDALDRPELLRVSDVSQSGTAPQRSGSAGISPFRWLASQVGLLDLLGATDAAAEEPVPISAREPDEPSWFDRTKTRLRETFPPLPQPEMVRDGRGGVWRKDIYDLIEDIAVAEPEDESALHRRISDVLADAPQTRDRWFHYELANRLDGGDPETIRAALRDWGHEDAIQTREVLSQLFPGIALVGSQLLQARARQPEIPAQVAQGLAPPAAPGRVLPAAPAQQPSAQQASGGSRGGVQTRLELQRLVERLLSLNPKLTPKRGSRNYKGDEVPEEYIPNPSGELLGDGRKKSMRPDATFVDEKGNFVRLEHADRTRFGKATDREETKAQDEFRWTHSNGYKEVVAPNVYKDLPQSNVYVVLKRHQLKRIEDRERGKPAKGPRARRRKVREDE